MRENQGNLTTGSVRKKLAVYALPLVLTSVLQALYSIADLVIAGQFIGKRSVSAINNSSQIMNLLTQVAVGTAATKKENGQGGLSFLSPSCLGLPAALSFI